MLKRENLIREVRSALRRSRAVALIGPRQCGKTTLARQLVSAESPNYLDLEDPSSIARLDEPMTALRGLKGLVVIDEVQRRPDLFPVLRVLLDRKPLFARFLILGRASTELLRQSSESLAGRIETISMSGFSMSEVGLGAHARHWLRGGFPPSFLARTEADSIAWRKSFIQTFLERDLPQWGIGTPSAALLRFWTMLAHYHGQTWKAAEPARSLGVSEPTVRRYLDLLTGLFMVRQLPPWHENLQKRQVKAPKVYFRDSGLLHQFLGIADMRALREHPRYGASWEGFASSRCCRRMAKPTRISGRPSGELSWTSSSCGAASDGDSSSSAPTLQPRRSRCASRSMISGSTTSGSSIPGRPLIPWTSGSARCPCATSGGLTS